MGDSYELIRKKNLQENKRILAELGIGFNPFKALPKIVQKPVKRKYGGDAPPPKKRKTTIIKSPAISGSIIQGRTRRSARLKGEEASAELKQDEEETKDDDDDDEEYTPRRRIEPGRPNVFGAIPGIEVGTVFATRMDSCAAGIHRPTVAGIHGGEEGAYSIALSGGYEDDVDLGECFTYTGQGGRDLKGTKNNPKNLRTAPQSKDQTLTHGNLALSKNVSSGNPVRVLRGYKLRSQFATPEGYRYDGLYSVEKFWFTTGLSGHGVYKFALKRLADQPPPPWDYKSDDSQEKPLSQADSGVCSGDDDEGTSERKIVKAARQKKVKSQEEENTEGKEEEMSEDVNKKEMSGVKQERSEDTPAENQEIYEEKSEANNKERMDEGKEEDEYKATDGEKETNKQGENTKESSEIMNDMKKDEVNKGRMDEENVTDNKVGDDEKETYKQEESNKIKNDEKQQEEIKEENDEEINDEIKDPEPNDEQINELKKNDDDDLKDQGSNVNDIVDVNENCVDVPKVKLDISSDKVKVDENGNTSSVENLMV